MYQATFSRPDLNSLNVSLVAESAAELLHDLKLFGISLGDASTTPAPIEAEPVKPKTVPPVAPITAEVVAPKADAGEPPAPPPESTTAEPLPYATLQKKVHELVTLVQKKGLELKEHVTAIAVKHGAPTFKGVPAENYQAAYDDVIAKLAELGKENA